MQRSLPFIALALLAFGGIPLPAGAQQAEPAKPPRHVVAQIMDLARENLQKAKLPDGSNVPPETTSEKAVPLIPVEDGARVVDAASTSAAAKWCGLEWEESLYRPFMMAERRRGIWSPKQMAYIGLIHGITMGSVENHYQAKGECPKSARANLERYIADRKPK